MTASKSQSHYSNQNSVLIISQDADMTRVWKKLFEQKKLSCQQCNHGTSRVAHVTARSTHSHYS